MIRSSRNQSLEKKIQSVVAELGEVVAIEPKIAKPTGSTGTAMRHIVQSESTKDVSEPSLYKLHTVKHLGLSL
jgi:hypothetical protein